MKLTPEQVKQKRQQRDILFQTLFAVESGGENNDNLLTMIAADLSEQSGQPVLLSDAQREQIRKQAEEILAKKEELDRWIGNYIQGWKIDRLTMVDRTVLRMATYELLFDQDMPPSVVINEAVVLAGKFNDEKSKAFVNGTLSSINKAINQTEKKAE